MAQPTILERSLADIPRPQESNSSINQLNMTFPINTACGTSDILPFAHSQTPQVPNANLTSGSNATDSANEHLWLQVSEI